MAGSDRDIKVGLDLSKKAKGNSHACDRNNLCLCPPNKNTEKPHLPWKWDLFKNDNQNFKQVALNKEDSEFKQIKKLLENCDFNITKIERIQSTQQWFKYCNEKKEMMYNRKDRSCNEKYLYHLTCANEADIRSILSEGLDFRVCEKKGFFGKGTYFSDDPRKCLQYAITKPGKTPFLLICRVLLGKSMLYQNGKYDKDLVREPLIEGTVDQRYDSVVGKPKDYKEYVLYNQRRCLVEYLIEYNRDYIPSCEINEESGEHWEIEYIRKMEAAELKNKSESNATALVVETEHWEINSKNENIKNGSDCIDDEHWETKNVESTTIDTIIPDENHWEVDNVQQQQLEFNPQTNLNLNQNANIIEKNETDITSRSMINSLNDTVNSFEEWSTNDLLYEKDKNGYYKVIRPPNMDDAEYQLYNMEEQRRFRENEIQHVITILEGMPSGDEQLTYIDPQILSLAKTRLNIRNKRLAEQSVGDLEKELTADQREKFQDFRNFTNSNDNSYMLRILTLSCWDLERALNLYFNSFCEESAS